MSNIRSKGTLPERLVAKELRKRKIYFSQHSKSIIGKPDFIFRRKKILVFVDSEFWHGHPTKLTMPKTNTKYWKAKILRNVERDMEVTEELTLRGWKVIRFWECEIKKNKDQCVDIIVEALDSNQCGQ